MMNRSLKTVLALVLGSCLFLVSCGKKADDQGSSTPVMIQPLQTAVDAFLEKQDVNCESNQACPNFIAKIVVVNGDKYEFCTGFLTDDDVVATSSSCLPSLIRLSGQDCSKDVFFFFPKTGNRPAERVGCSKVLQASQLDGTDPVFWRDDVSFLQLSTPLPNRRQVMISRDGITNNKEFMTWMIDQQGDYSAIVKRSICDSVHQNYINPLVMNESSPGMIFADCAVTNGSTGAPILDGRGKVRAIISKGIDSKLRAYLESTGLLTNGLKDMFHATNFACAGTLTNSDMLDEKECLKDLTYQKVDRARSEMLATNMLFGDLRKNFEKSLDSISKYVQFGVKLIPKGDLQETEIYPKCFKTLDTWLPNVAGRNNFVEMVKIPVRSFRRTMDAYGRIQGTAVDAPAIPTQIQFSLKSLRGVQKSTILMWITGVEGYKTFPDLSQECSPSLF
jgi:hypothetical protein